MRALLLLLMFFSIGMYAQDRTLTLKHKSSGSLYEVDPQKAIKCRLSDGEIRKGYIQNITDESIVMNGDSVKLENIVVISSWHTRKNASAKTGGILLTSLGGILTVGGVAMTAGAVQEDDEVGTVVVGVPLGIATTVAGIGTSYLGIRALKRKRFDLADWDLKVNNY